MGTSREIDCEAIEVWRVGKLRAGKANGLNLRRLFKMLVSKAAADESTGGVASGLR